MRARDRTLTTALHTLSAAMWNAQGDRRSLSPDPGERDPAADGVGALSHTQEPERVWSIALALGHPPAVIPDRED
jgi:hypothetical protein